MITVLIHYKAILEARHALLDDEYIIKTKVLKVIDLTDLNNMGFEITKIDILEKD